MRNEARSSRRWRTRHGFSVIELVSTMVVFGVVAAIGGPKFLQGVRRQATITAADIFQREHELTRAAAIRYGRVARLHIDVVNNRFWVDADTSGTGVRDTIGPVRSVKSYGLQITSTDSLMCFDARGFPSTTSAVCQPQNSTLIFSLDGRSDTTTVTILGKVLR